MNDIPLHRGTNSERIRPLAEFMGSLSFLTRLPVPFAKTVDLPPLRQSMRIFAIVGGLIGALIGAVLAGLGAGGVDTHIAATLAVAAGILLTGGLHEDGLADMSDGFGGGRDRAQRLDIMRDSRIGSYGTMALIIALALRGFSFAALLDLPAIKVVALVAATGAFSRAMVVDLMWSTRPARSDGLGAMTGRPSRNTALFAILSAIVICAAAGYAFRAEAIVLGLAAATLTTALLRHMAIRLIDGHTGDVCGAVQVLSEAAMLAVFASMVH